MKIKGIGIDIDPLSQVGMLQSLDKVLSQMEDIGFEYAEIAVDFPQGLFI